LAWLLKQRGDHVQFASRLRQSLGAAALPVEVRPSSPACVFAVGGVYESIGCVGFNLDEICTFDRPISSQLF